MELLENNEMTGYQADTENTTPKKQAGNVRKQDSNPQEKIDRIASLFGEIMTELDLDLTDDSLQDTPRRVAKMYVNEIFRGLDANKEPRISNFDNVYGYHGPLIERNIQLKSFCEHHFLPIYGVAHVGYIPTDKVIGLSKLNRIVEYFARRPQVQERLTVDIANHLQKVLGTEDVAIVIDAKHMCVEYRGVEHCGSSTVTEIFRGKFEDPHQQRKFLDYIK